LETSRCPIAVPGFGAALTGTDRIKIMNTPLAFNGDRFAQETIDGETIVLDTVGGRLLLLRESAPLLLSIIGAGVTPQNMQEEISNRYGAEAAAQARDFVAGLAELGVFVAAHIAEPSLEPKAVGAFDWPPSFVPPVVEQYDDIADIITLDPIHDVEVDGGWPRAATISRE
jgi:hypothetical protein